MDSADKKLTQHVDPSSPGVVSILKAERLHSCSKTIKKVDGKVKMTSYSAPKTWDLELVDVKNLRGLLDLLRTLSERTECIIIHGAPKIEQRKGIVRRAIGDEATFEGCARNWLAIDVDSAVLPAEQQALDVEKQIRYVRDHMLPTQLQKANCVWQLTSGQGFKPGLRVRYWFWMDRPVKTALLRQFFRNEPLVDASIFLPVQPIYINNPTFGDGVADPVTKRIGVCKGEEREVATEGFNLDALAEAQAFGDRMGSIVQRKDITPNIDQIERAIDGILAQKTGDSRHHHAFGAACELYALGAEPAQIAACCHQLISQGGRQPQEREIANFIRDAAAKDEAGQLHTTNEPIDVMFGDDPLDPDDLPPDVIEELESVSEEELDTTEQYGSGSSDHHNSRVYLQREHPNHTFMRWQGADWMYDGKKWQKFSDSEVLEGRVTRAVSDAIKSSSKITGIARHIRRLCQKESAGINTWFDDYGTKSESPVVVFKNGMLLLDDLEFGETTLAKHDPNFFNVGVLDYNYDPAAKCPRFLECIDQWFPTDKIARVELQKIFGYILSGRNDLEKFFVFTDSVMGRTGKGTCCTILNWLVGSDNIAGVTVESLAERFGLSQLVGRTLAFISEANDQNSLPSNIESLMKAVSGNDPLPIEFKGGHITTDTLSTRFILSANRMPNFSDNSGAFAKRMHMLVFGQSFLGKEDPTLKKVGGPLHSELPGIFNWAMEGLTMLNAAPVGKKFQDSPAANSMREEFTRKCSPVSAFVADCFLPSITSGNKVRMDDAFEVYKVWCGHQEIKPRSRQSFVIELRSTMGFDRTVRMNQKSDGLMRRVACVPCVTFNEEGLDEIGAGDLLTSGQNMA